MQQIEMKLEDVCRYLLSHPRLCGRIQTLTTGTDDGTHVLVAKAYGILDTLYIYIHNVYENSDTFPRRVLHIIGEFILG